MASIRSAHFAEPHFACLDMVQLDAGYPMPEDAILLEIWEHGAMVQTSFPIAEGSTVGIVVERKHIAGQVTRCEPDQSFGYVVDVTITGSNEWFPTGYLPAWQASAENIVPAGFVC